MELIGAVAREAVLFRKYPTLPSARAGRDPSGNR